jgi:hypothetical protein
MGTDETPSNFALREQHVLGMSGAQRRRSA